MKPNLFNLHHKTQGSIELKPMTHIEACSMKRKMCRPADWLLVPIKSKS